MVKHLPQIQAINFYFFSSQDIINSIQIRDNFKISVA